MKRSRFKEEQIIGFIKEFDTGAKVDAICRREGFSSATFYAWRKRSTAVWKSATLNG